MQFHRGFLALVALAGLTVSAFGQDTATLKWKFEKDKPFYQTMTTTTEQTMKVMGTDVKQTQAQTFWFSWTPKEQLGDGSWVVEQKIEGIRMSIDIGGNKVEYDSTKEQQGNNPLADFFKALVGSSFKVTIGKDFKVKDVTGQEEFVKALSKANPQMTELLNKILSKQALIDMADPTFSVVPDKEVKKGDKWNKTSNLDMGPIGKYENKFDYTYDGLNGDAKNDAEKKYYKIKVETTLKYSPPTVTEGTSSLPFKIKGANLTSSSAGGTILFDNDQGRIASSDMSLKLEGELQIEISGQLTKVNLDQKQSTKVTTSAEKPPELKKGG